MRVLVTGASGFIGGAVCAALRRRGHDVSALVRRAGSEPDDTSAVTADLRDGEALALGVAEARPECIVHLAAEIASQRDAGKLHEVNVEGTRRLLAACGEQSPRFVLASTVVTGDADGAELTEDRPLPVATPYGRSKQQAERLVAESGLPSCVVRPSHVYGPGGWYGQEIVPLLRRPGRFAVIGSGANLWDVVHVDDVAEAFVLAAESAPPGSTYHVADDAPVTYYDFMALTARELGVGPPRHIPPFVARLAVGANAVDAVVRSARSSNARIKSELGLTLRFPTAREGVPDAIARLGAQENARSASSAT